MDRQAFETAFSQEIEKQAVSLGKLDQLMRRGATSRLGAGALDFAPGEALLKDPKIAAAVARISKISGKHKFNAPETAYRSLPKKHRADLRAVTGALNKHITKTTKA